MRNYLNRSTPEGRLTVLGTGLLLVCILVLPLVARGAEAPKPWRGEVERFAREHFRHPAWGYSHSVRDYELAVSLAREDHVAIDDEVLYAASMLHDMAAFKPWDREAEGIDHADEGARVIDQVLGGTDFPAGKLDAVRNAIRSHMYDRTPSGPEATYLHDADALDWLGAIGVARIFALVDPAGGDPTGPAAAKMLEDFLRNVPGRILSPAGKRRMPVRRDELKGYLRHLSAETAHYRTL